MVIKNQALGIKGMHCASCASRIEKTLGKLDGVKRASVNLVTEKALVAFDPGKVSIDKIIKTVKDIGFEAFDEPVKTNENNENNELKKLKIWTVTSVSFALPLLYIAMAPMVSFIRLPFAGVLHHLMIYNPLNYALLQLMLTIPAIICGNTFYKNGIKAFLKRSPNMDSLIAIGTTAAFCYSIYSTWLIFSGNSEAADHLYYETAGVIIALILLGKTMEAVSKGRTKDALKKLIELAPKTAIITVNDGTGKILEKEIPINDVKPGDIVIVKPGAKIPADGFVIDGFSCVDESMLTGESIPVDKKPGDKIFGASININGVLRFKAEKVGEDTILAQIIKLMEDAQGSKAPIAALGDKVAAGFVPAVCVIALIAGIAWFLGTGGDTEFALKIFISVLVIACPCAIGLATPAAIMAATGKGAENGILIKSGQALEIAGRIDTVVFDKTGTITEGRPKVVSINLAQRRGNTEDAEEEIYNEIYLLQLAASAEKNSEHPIGKAIVEEAKNKKIDLLPIEDFLVIPGMGVKATIRCVRTEGSSAPPRAIMIGNNKLINNNVGEGIFVKINNELAGTIKIADTVKPSSKAAIESLHKMGIKTVMITGDNIKTADNIAKQVGIDHVIAEVLPHEKAAEVKRMQNEGRRIAFAGDGINDAPVLAQADAGIAVGSGTDIAIESADIVLMKSDPADVPKVIKLSRRALRTIKQNLFWAFCYNVLGIPIAAGLLHLFGGPLLNPMFAAAAMSLSSVSVVTNALRLKQIRLN